MTCPECHKKLEIGVCVGPHPRYRFKDLPLTPEQNERFRRAPGDGEAREVSEDRMTEEMNTGRQTAYTLGACRRRERGRGVHFVRKHDSAALVSNSHLPSARAIAESAMANARAEYARNKVSDLGFENWDECECGDYRLSHESGKGKCSQPNDLSHGFKVCKKFRRFSQAREIPSAWLEILGVSLTQPNPHLRGRSGSL